MCAGACLGNIRGGAESEGAVHTGTATAQCCCREGLPFRDDRRDGQRCQRGGGLGDGEIHRLATAEIGIGGCDRECVVTRIGRCRGSRRVSRPRPTGITVAVGKITHTGRHGDGDRGLT